MQSSIEVKTVRVNGTELHYVEQGKGNGVVFVHGSLSDYRTWRFQMEPFAERYRVIAYSRRYHYPNMWSGNGSDYSASLHADDLAELVRAFGSSRAHIVASSYGAYTALVMAARYPQLVQSLVIGEPPMLPLLKNNAEGVLLFESFVNDAWEPARKAFQADDMELGVKHFVEGVAGKGTFDKLPPPARANMMDNAREMKAETAAGNYFPPFTRGHAENIQAPILFLTGAASPRLFHVITDRLRSWLPGAGHVEIPGASHSMHSNNPSFYNETVMKFLDSQTR